ncbi:MAG: D-alanyl-D-alanine carboxypeptidase, partial [Clostridia bacterium]|nr:D-alanyl-D-alanine carboxypeptidase [Clostridia bacterium]
MQKLSLLLCLAIAFSLVNLSAPACAYAYTLSRGEMVMERDSGRVLYEYNADAKLPMASTTKVVTALTVIENFDTKKVVTV